MCVDRNNLYGTMKLLYVDEKAYDKNEIELLYVNCERPKTKLKQLDYMNISKGHEGPELNWMHIF